MEDVVNRQLVIVPWVKMKTIIHVTDDTATGGHLGIFKTVGKLRQNFWWITLKTDVQNYIRHCRKCTQKTRRALLARRPVGYPLECIAMDIKGPLSMTSRGNKYILVISDYFTKYSEAYPLENQEAETVGGVLCSEWIDRLGVPRQILYVQIVGQTLRVSC